MLRASGAVTPALGRFASAIAWLLLIGIGVFAALLLVVRMIVFPNIEHYRGTITEAIASQIRQPVEIDTLSTAWDGWNPKLVIGGFRIGPRTADGAPGVLELPRVELTLSWTSVPLMEPRLQQLLIHSPRLAVRRDAAGVVHVAGIEIDPARAVDDSGFTEWLLRQREIVVRNALVTWVDEHRDAPQLVLDDVTFRLENGFGGHRFGLTGRPPAELAAPIDVRGDFTGRSLREWQRSEGRIYVRLDYADIAAWREWLPLPLEIDRGEGALRAWFDFADGQVRDIVADVELAEVHTRLAPDLPVLALAHVSGRAGWRSQRTAREVYCRELAFTTLAGQTFAPTDLSLVMRTNDAGVLEHGRLEFERVELAPLREIAEHLPLTARWRADLVALAPHGTVLRGTMQWDGPADAPTSFDGRADFSNVGWIARGDWPGATGMSGSLKATSRGGEVKIGARDATLAVPRVLATAIPLETVNGGATWVVSAEQLTLRIDELTFANADAAGRLRGTYRRAGPGPGAIDLDATLMRALPQALPRYVPIFLSEGVRGWVTRAIRDGRVDEVKLKLKGDLAAFPFPDDRNGLFAIDVKGRDFTLDYAEGWPALTGIDGQAHFHGAGLRVDGTKARVHGVDVGPTTAVIADLRAPVLVIDGSASGPTRDFLRFVDDSPVHAWIDDFTRGTEAAGEGRLALKFALPLHGSATTSVSGEFSLVNNQVKLSGVPALAQVNGRIAFTNQEVRARDVTAEALGGPVRISVAVAEGRTRIGASGSANLQSVRREFAFPLASHVSGTADWSFTMDSRGDATTWALDSPLKGVTIDLPPPLAKAAGDTRPMRIERRPIAGSTTEDTLIGRMGDDAHVIAHRRLDGGAARVDRLLVALGRATRPPDARGSAPGLWIRAELPEIDIDQWLTFKREDLATAVPGATGDLALNGIDIDAPVLTAFGRNFTAMKVRGRRVQDDWKLDLSGEEVAGTATWSAPGERSPNGRVVARLTRLSSPAAKPSTSPANASSDDASTWPELDVAADAFNSKGRDLGQLELVAKPSRGEWRIERLVLANDAGRMQASGAWRAGARPEQTTLDVTLDVKDGGAYLARFGHPGLVQGAATKITGQLAWDGDPSDFDYPSLSGSFRMDVGSGRFMKVEPGFGKLLGVLSLQALPRRISLDFRDIFSEGFSFDRVSGTVRIAHGVMSSDELRLIGSSAQIAIAGEADLDHETQRLRVRVQPTLSAGVSAGAALMFLANPIVGAAVGAGSLLAQKVLRDPIEQMFSHEYLVTGSWSDPHVTRGATATAAVPKESSIK